MKTLAEAIANTVVAYHNCNTTPLLNVEWKRNHLNYLRELEQELPSGSGWDCGTSLVLDKCGHDRLVMTGSFHHMDSETGMYDGWTNHTITVKASLVFGFNITVSGRNRNDIKDYLVDLFHAAMERPAPEPARNSEVAE